MKLWVGLEVIWVRFGVWLKEEEEDSSSSGIGVVAGRLGFVAGRLVFILT